MATFYSCDRCGQTCRIGADIVESVTLKGWNGDGSVPARDEAIDVSVVMVRPYVDYEKPDLCRKCKAEVLTLALEQFKNPDQPGIA